MTNRPAADLAAGLTGLLLGKDATADLLNRRGQADLDRIDRVTRNITREADHVFWLKERQLRAALVQQGARIAAYAYGGADQVGPVGGSTQEAALAALGWAIDLALDAGATGNVELRIPSPFQTAVEALLDTDALLDPAGDQAGLGERELAPARCDTESAHDLPFSFGSALSTSLSVASS